MVIIWNMVFFKVFAIKVFIVVSVLTKIKWMIVRSSIWSILFLPPVYLISVKETCESLLH